MPARRYTGASHLQGGLPMISSRSGNASTPTAYKECPAAGTSVPDLVSTSFSGADAEAGQTGHAAPASETTGSSIAIPQLQLPIINLKDFGVTSVDCFFALKDPASYLPKTLTGERKRSKRSKSQNPARTLKAPNSFVVCRAANYDAVLNAIAQVEGARATTRRGSPGTNGKYSKIMGNIWKYMTEREKSVYSARSKYLEPLYKEENRVRHNDEEEQVNANNDDNAAGYGTLPSREAMGPTRTNRNRQRPQTSRRRHAVIQADSMDVTSQNTSTHHAPSHTSSNLAGTLPFQSENIAPHVQPHRLDRESMENEGVFLSRYPQAHHLHNFSSAAPTRNRRHSGSPYFRASVGGPSGAAQVSSQSSYTASQPFVSGLPFTSSSTIPRPSAPRRALRDITNVNRPANLDVPSPQISNGEQSFTVSNSAWLHRGFDSVDQEGVLPYTISNYSAHSGSNATASGMDSYPTFRTDDYIPIDPQLLSLYNGETASMLGNADEVSQQGSYNHRH